MTCIVGYIDKINNKTYIGGDSAGVSWLDVSIRKDVKVFKVGEFVIGCTSSFRMIQLLRFSFTPPKKYEDDDIYKYMCTEFVNQLRRCFKDGGYARRDGVFLVGWKNRLFSIQGDYQVGESEKDYDSVGCGETYALGALDALEGNDMNIQGKIKTALYIAAYRSGGVRPPFIIEST